MEGRGICDEGAGTGLGGIFPRRRTEPGAELRRVAARSFQGRGGACGVDSAGNLEGLAGVSFDRGLWRSAPESSSRGAVRIFWKGIVRDRAAASALAAGGVRGERPVGRRGGSGLCPAIFLAGG